MQTVPVISPSLFWISRSLHHKLKLGNGSSSSLTDLSQAKTPTGAGGEKGGTTGGLAEECSKDKGTQQRRAGANATWNRLVWDTEIWHVYLQSVLTVRHVGLLYQCENVFYPSMCLNLSCHHAYVYTHVNLFVYGCLFHCRCHVRINSTTRKLYFYFYSFY